MKTIADIQAAVEAFAAERDWNKFHSPKNLAMALSVEAAELLEHFQWLSEEQSQNLNNDVKKDVAREIADIQVYLARIAAKLQIDIYSAVTEKMQENAEKYPADKVRGKADKYTAYQNDSTNG